jgi:cytochrome P450
MITMLVAGHETVAASVQWAVLALCKYPEIQSRLRGEIRGKQLGQVSPHTRRVTSVIAHLPATIPSEESLDPQPPSSAQIDSLPYLNAFCNEVLRFSPPVRSTVRVATKDTSLGGVPVPKGTQLLIVPGATNLNPDFWGPDAEVFNPERWMGEGQASNGGANGNYANLTFLYGPRGCIGQTFAKSEFACMIAVIAGRFKIELQDPTKRVEVVTAISASPKDGVMAKLTRLEGW